MALNSGSGQIRTASSQPRHAWNTTPVFGVACHPVDAAIIVAQDDAGLDGRRLTPTPTHSTVTLFARFLGLSTSVPLATAV